MQTFSEMLKKLMDVNHYTTYQLAHLSGVNRTTIQRAVTSGRCPQKSAFEKLAGSLNLTPKEHLLFSIAYERASEGDFNYFCRRHIKNLLENSDSMVTLLEKPIFISQTLALKEPLPYQTLLQGFSNICRLFKALVAQEAALNKSSVLSLAFPSDQKYFVSFFQDVKDFLPSASIRHLISLIRNPAILSTHRNYNLDLLANLLPFILAADKQYKVHYQYCNYMMNDSDYNCFPYYILFSQSVLLFSPDLDTAWLSQDMDMVNYLTERFDGLYETASRLLHTLQIEEQFLFVSKRCDSLKFIYSIGYQPCFTCLLDRELCGSIAAADFPETGQMTDFLIEISNKIFYSKDSINIFHEKSLEEFIEHGIIMTIPKELARPLKPEERLRILIRLYKCCQENSPVIRLINPLSFSLPHHLAINITGKNSVELLLYYHTEQKYRTIHILENTLFETFSDFLSYLPRSTLVYDQETSLLIIDKYIKRLGNMIL